MFKIQLGIWKGSPFTVFFFRNILAVFVGGYLGTFLAMYTLFCEFHKNLEFGMQLHWILGQFGKNRHFYDVEFFIH